MSFDYDPEKSAANKAKHGIDFEEAQPLWRDENLLAAPARSEDEPCFIVIGRIAEMHWSAICTQRGEQIRIISVRRARKEEIDRYESA